MPLPKVVLETPSRLLQNTLLHTPGRCQGISLKPQKTMAERWRAMLFYYTKQSTRVYTQRGGLLNVCAYVCMRMRLRMHVCVCVRAKSSPCFMLVTDIQIMLHGWGNAKVMNKQWTWSIRLKQTLRLSGQSGAHFLFKMFLFFSKKGRKPPISQRNQPRECSFPELINGMSVSWRKIEGFLSVGHPARGL